MNTAQLQTIKDAMDRGHKVVYRQLSSHYIEVASVDPEKSEITWTHEPDGMGVTRIYCEGKKLEDFFTIQPLEQTPRMLTVDKLNTPPVYMASEIKSGDDWTAPLRVVISHDGAKRVVVHTQNCQDGGRFDGTYCHSHGEAVMRAIERCQMVGVRPLLSYTDPKVKLLSEAGMRLAGELQSEGYAFTLATEDHALLTHDSHDGRALELDDVYGIWRCRRVWPDVVKDPARTVPIHVSIRKWQNFGVLARKVVEELLPGYGDLHHKPERDNEEAA